MPLNFDPTAPDLCARIWFVRRRQFLVPASDNRAVVVTGILFMVASATLDPNDASGLDGALKALIRVPFGQVILIGVGVGFACYGVYSFVRARFARL